MKRIFQRSKQLSFENKLQLAFPGSEWMDSHAAVETATGPDSLHPGTIEMVCIGTGPGPKNVLATDGIVYPYRKFKALKGTPIRPLPASTELQVSPTLDTRGAGAELLPELQAPIYAIVGGTKFDASALDSWVQSLPKNALVVTGNGRGAEKALIDLLTASGIRVDVPTRLDVPKALEIQLEAILSMTQDSLAPIVLVGNGQRVKQAKSWLKRAKWGREIIEI